MPALLSVTARGATAELDLVELEVAPTDAEIDELVHSPPAAGSALGHYSREGENHRVGFQTLAGSPWE